MSHHLLYIVDTCIKSTISHCRLFCQFICFTLSSLQSCQNLFFIVEICHMLYTVLSSLVSNDLLYIVVTCVKWSTLRFCHSCSIICSTLSSHHMFNIVVICVKWPASYYRHLSQVNCFTLPLFVSNYLFHIIVTCVPIFCQLLYTVVTCVKSLDLHFCHLSQILCFKWPALQCSHFCQIISLSIIFF